MDERASISWRGFLLLVLGVCISIIVLFVVIIPLMATPNTNYQPNPIYYNQQNQAPVISCEVRDEQGVQTYFVRIGDTLTFDASNSYDPDGYIHRYEWRFPSNSQYGETITHTISSQDLLVGYPGISVPLIITDDDGKTSTYYVSLGVDE